MFKSGDEVFVTGDTAGWGHGVGVNDRVRLIQRHENAGYNRNITKGWYVVCIECTCGAYYGHTGVNRDIADVDLLGPVTKDELEQTLESIKRSANF